MDFRPRPSIRTATYGLGMTRSMHDTINIPSADALHRVPKNRRPDRAPRRSDGRTCLVAVDGSDASVHALVWGFRYATDRGMCVEVLTVWPSHRSVLIHEVPGHVSAARWSARSAQADVIRRALEEVLDRPITAARLENADAGTAIVHASARCDLVVMGSNSNDSSHSLTDRVLEEAACEVVVVGSSGHVLTTTRSVLAHAARPGRGT